ncbi:hypothetical protein HYW75_05545 [Candidatus Pacearchaeota archaeon]|nr:hypothetical protein [Candidatus Pacearchaeota archaeon]
MKFNKLFILSGLYFIFSILFSLDLIYGITGFSIINLIEVSSINVFGIIFFFIALLLFVAGRDEEGKLVAKVYDASGGKNKEHDATYTFVDSSGNRFTLGEMRNQINKFMQENEGKELVEIMKNEYSPFLHMIADSSDDEQNRIAWSFLEVLGEKRPKEEKNFGLSKEQEREIREAFRNYNGNLAGKQRDILSKYGFNVGKRGDGHIGFRYKKSGYFVITSSSPSDWRAGRNLASDIIDVLEKARKAEYEKQQEEK